MKSIRVLLYHWNSMHERWVPSLGDLHIDNSEFSHPFWKSKGGGNARRLNAEGGDIAGTLPELSEEDFDFEVSVRYEKPMREDTKQKLANEK